MNTRLLFKTEDGTISFIDQNIGEAFHSHFGAVTESNHIFIQSALEFIQPFNDLNILEIGWGTGLNSLLTLAWQRANRKRINYFAIEKFPLKNEEYSELNYDSFINGISVEDILQIHNAEWNMELEVSPDFKITKSLQDIMNMKLCINHFDIVFFDAFSPEKQPLLWQESVFINIYNSMKINGILTTYSVKGEMRRILKKIGFEVEKIPGPVGKREITRAIKR